MEVNFKITVEFDQDVGFFVARSEGDMAYGRTKRMAMVLLLEKIAKEWKDWEYREKYD